jgi:hypothetical protein
MHSRYDRFRKSKLGSDLEKLIDTPERYIEYRVLSRLGIPAVAALVADLEERFPEVKYDTFACQFCGSMVAEVMRRHRHILVRARVSVPGKFFTRGAVWSPEPLLGAEEVSALSASIETVIGAASEPATTFTPLH